MQVERVAQPTDLIRKACSGAPDWTNSSVKINPIKPELIANSTSLLPKSSG